MPGLRFEPFSEARLDDAAELLATRHRQHREAEPLLSEPDDYRAEVAALLGAEDASGVFAHTDGRAAGFMLGIGKSVDTWGPNMWVEPAGHAAVGAELIRDLYGAAAEGWVAAGRTRHYVMAPALEAALDAWSRVGFGHQQGYAAHEIPDAAWPEGVRVAEERDIEGLVELGPLLDEHQAASPVFSSISAESEEEIRAEIAQDLVNPEAGTLVAEREGRIIGCFFLAPVSISPSHASLARVDGALLLAWAATRPEVRGSGAGLSLTKASYAWARERDYTTMVVDWRETNLLSSRFWPARGFRRTFIRLYRSIP